MNISPLSSAKRAFTHLWFFLKGLGTKRPIVTVLAALLLLVLVLGALFFGPGRAGNTEESTENRAASVTLIPVGTYAGTTGTTATSGGTEAVLRAETSGKIVQVLPVGTRVGPGGTVALFENASQQAALLQAEGALEAAQAALEKTKGGLRSEKIAVLQAAYESAQSGAVATLLSAYAAVDSAVRDSADQTFSNPSGANPQLTIASSDAQRRIDAQNQRLALNTVLARETTASETVTTESDLEAELTTTESEIRAARSLIDTLIAVLNEAIPTGGVTSSNIAAYKAAATAARTSLTGALSSIASARAALETAKQNLDEGLSGAESSDLAAAQASVKQAQGAYNAARAAYEKTVVRARTSGTVTSCNAAMGDVLSVGADICRIRTSGTVSSDAFVLPLSSVKYTPTGASVFVVSEQGTLQALSVTTGLVAANGITVYGLSGDEYVVEDVRGLKAGETVRIQ